MDTTQFNSAFWITITGMVLSFGTGIGIYFLKSKCTTCSFCFGLVKIERDVLAENNEEQMELENQISYDPSKK
jgi:hypothetical protein